MKNARILNRIVTTMVLVGVVSLSIPQHSYAFTEGVDELQRIQQTQQNATQNNTTPNQSSTGSQNQPIELPDGDRIRDNQAGAYDSDTSGVSGGTGSAGGAVSDALGCSASSLLGQAVSLGLKSLVGNTVASQVSSAASQAVPIESNSKFDNLAAIFKATDANTAVNAIQQLFGLPIGASFNGIAYCIVNGLITYIADSTIAWANSGFQGNPAFLENPENFFKTLGDRQASQFISDLGYNATGLNVCEPFRVDLAVALSESYGAEQNGVNPRRLSCSMDQISQNFMDFANGGGYGGSGGGPNIEGYWSNWNQMRQNENNPWGAYIEAGEYLRAQVAVKENTAKFELGLNSGYLSFKKCEDKVAAKKGDTSSCKTYTPGSLIESSLQDTLKIPKERLVAAEKIDQVITALANALIKKALNTVLSKE